MTYVTESLQRNIKELRSRNAWSQENLARVLDVSLSTVQRWETKGTKPSRLATKELNKLFRKNGIKVQRR
jgi:DNA-binding transcriptional regulator YiaG